MTVSRGRRHDRRSRLRVLLCDSCCCGTERKHPGIDHAGIRDRLSAAARSAGGRSRRVDCVGVCKRSNVVVVKTRGAGSIWVGDVLEEPLVAALENWIAADTPMPVPTDIAAHVFPKPSSADDTEGESAVDAVDVVDVVDAVELTRRPPA